MNKLLLTTLCALALSACGGEQKAAETQSASPATAETTSSKPVLRVHSEALYEPFITRSSTNQIEGFDLDLLKAIGEKQGFDVKFEARPFLGLLDSLAKDEADIVSSGVSITDTRKAVVDFSDVYFEGKTVLLLGKNATDVQGWNELKGKSVSVQQGTPNEHLIKDNGATPIETESTWLAVKSTIAGETPATFGDSAALGYYLHNYSKDGLRMIELPNSPVNLYAFAVKKGNHELLNKLNTGLAQIKSDGTYEQIQNKWFANK
ncbi:transporter substrate-binding domain-containing protein [Wielerella bovis]|uniref:transporter substrate-binding domain-containing protein n=1 Tax=Wielerella bovis TaxID=2917790 RepID=UPI002018AB62|nr:transporter substrate-binding domain-containing protein [Wielerella bovis]ULJ63872.1 transporter substrate-binding domain-containing protein [Wielerella bovis]ULJ65961.1 transporter substrate-binding domain-containing protein [Wielerella bovis]